MSSSAITNVPVSFWRTFVLGSASAPIDNILLPQTAGLWIVRVDLGGAYTRSLLSTLPRPALAPGAAQIHPPAPFTQKDVLDLWLHNQCGRRGFLAI